VKWTEAFRGEVVEHLKRLGLSNCPICDSETTMIGVYEKPALLVSGGAAPDTMTDLLVRLECNMCGYNLLFNAEQFRDGESPITEAR
jgi:hypothetical protein